MDELLIESRAAEKTERNSSTTYQNVKEKLLDMISRMEPGTKLDSRMELARQFSVNKTTLDYAVAELIGQGFLYTKAKSGTYVSGNMMSGKGNKAATAWTVIIPNIINDTYPGIYLGIQNVADSMGVQLILKSTEGDGFWEQRYLESLDEKIVQGAIVIPTVSDQAVEATYSEVKERGIPLVLCNRDIYSLGAPCVRSNNFVGGYLMTKHLLEQGCRNIAFVSKFYYETTYERYEGYALALREAGLEVNEEYCIWNYNMKFAESGDELTRRLLQKCPEIDGIFCFNDQLAVGAMSACMEAGLKVGEDIAIGGYDNSSICTSVSSKITSVDFRSYDIGVQAAEILCKLIQGTLEPEQRKITLLPYLVERDSSHLKKQKEEDTDL